MRDRTIDIIKGVAMLFVFLAHSIVYHPVHLTEMYGWCKLLDRFITSFCMPLFFIVSGYLFSCSRKTGMAVILNKIKRLAVPYLFTALVVCGFRLFLSDGSDSYNGAMSGGFWPLAFNWLFEGGDRWFVFVLFWMFVIFAFVKPHLYKRWFAAILVLSAMAIYSSGILPKRFRLTEMVYYTSFFLIGFSLKPYWNRLMDFLLRYRYIVFALFVACNCISLLWVPNDSFLFRFCYPLIGSSAMAVISSLMSGKCAKTKVVSYVEYVGKYSLQFYLFTFAYPLIRVLVVSRFHIESPFMIIPLVFVLQLVTSTVIVEVTRRMKFIKVLCGY